jgi:hypothetical protein
MQKQIQNYATPMLSSPTATHSGWSHESRHNHTDTRVTHISASSMRPSQVSFDLEIGPLMTLRNFHSEWSHQKQYFEK